MAYDEALADRVRAILSGRHVVEKKMMGGLTFMVDGRMVCGIFRGDLLARVGAEGHDEALARPHVRVMDLSGRVMRGFVVVEVAGLTTRRSLERWIEAGIAIASTAPASKTRKSTTKTKPGAPKKSSAKSTKNTAKARARKTSSKKARDT